MSANSRKSGFAAPRTRPVLITGGAGFIGTNLADRLAREKEDVLVVDNLQRAGVENNIKWLQRLHPRKVSFIRADIRDEATATAAIHASAIFHLAAQVAVTTSLAAPLEDLDVNLRGTVRLLEAVRRSGRSIPFIFASTNKVYGDLGFICLENRERRVSPLDAGIRQNGIDENHPLAFHTPYGCSKGGADQYILDYARTFAVPAAVLRMSCIYGPHQFGTEDQGWVAHFLICARDRRPITIYGDGRQVRDILYVGDAVEAYVRALRQINAMSGRAFNLGGGPSNAVSLLELIDEIGALKGYCPELVQAPARPSDQRYFVSDPRQLRDALQLPAFRPWRRGVADLARWLDEDQDEVNHPRNISTGAHA